MEDLKNITVLVKSLLITKPETRNSDEILFLELLKVFGFSQGRNFESMSISHFISNRKIYGIPNFETVRRTRQKIQAANPDLKAVKPVEDARAEKETEFRAYAISETA